MWRYWNVPKLITKEDVGHVHKVLGLAALCSFLYRTYLVIKYRHMNFGADWQTAAVITGHGALSLSSLIFHLPSNRVKAAPMIYPEFRYTYGLTVCSHRQALCYYRAHSILFAMRSLVAMALIALSQALDSPIPLYLRGANVILTMFIADKITDSFKDHGTTMRAMPFPEYVPKWFRKYLNTFYSVSQLFATANCIFAGSEEAFITVFPIQIAALLMTCVRKSIISAGAWHYYYTMALLSNYFFSPIVGLFRSEFMSQHGLPIGRLFFLSSFAVIYFRIFFPRSVNKYVLWGSVACAHLVAQLALGWYTSYPQSIDYGS